jgi:hypothetical protein
MQGGRCTDRGIKTEHTRTTVGLCTNSQKLNKGKPESNYQPIHQELRWNSNTPTPYSDLLPPLEIETK